MNLRFLGHKHSEETKKRMSKSAQRIGTGKWLKGRKRPEEVKKKISESSKGKKCPWNIEKNKTAKMRESSSRAGKMSKGRKATEEMKRNMSKAQRGRKHTELTKKKIGNAHRGLKCNFWKGGITPIHKLVRTKVEYKAWRLSVYERDNFTCQMPGCGIRGGRLEVHHIKEFSKYPRLIFEIANGITLCEKCHKKIKSREKQFESLFTEIIKPKS